MSRSPSNVRLLQALMVTMGVVLSLRAATTAQAAAAASGEAEPDSAAEPGAEPPAAAPTLPASTGADRNPPPGDADAFTSATGLSAEELAVLQNLGQRRAALEARERALDDRASLLDAAEQRISQRITELKKVEASIESLIGKVDQEEETRLNGLVNVYSRMRAKDAAAIFNVLQPDVQVAVAKRMKEPVLAEILGQMTPTAARRLTEMLAAVQKLPEEASALVAGKDSVATVPAAPGKP